MQHSWLCSWLCDEQGMLLQHCIASSGVVIAPQSIAYAAITTAIAMSKITFTRRIYTKLCALSVGVKATNPRRLWARRAYLTPRDRTDVRFWKAKSCKEIASLRWIAANWKLST